MIFIRSWQFKLIISLICAFIAAFSNYYSLKAIIGNKRIDLMGFVISDYYALFLTALFDLLIIYFHLIHLRVLVYMSVACSWVVSEYTWTLLIQEKLNFGFQFVDFILCTFLASIPLVILNVLMRDVAEELDVV